MKPDPEQLEAIGHPTSTVVLAGPGSGKTYTLVEKVSYLTQHIVPAPFAVACITLSNDAVTEFTTRLQRQGIRPGRNLFLGTLHSFCLTRVIKPYGHLVGVQTVNDRKVLNKMSCLSLLQTVLDEESVNEQARWFTTTLRKIRMDIACNGDLSAYDERHVQVAKKYMELLNEQQTIDFESMTIEALNILEANPSVRDLIASRFSWIVVDEYQDLGGVLHRIILLLKSSGVKIFAVGDPDQSIFGFNGAKPTMVNELEQLNGFHSVRLKYNYRSGPNLLEAAASVLNTDSEQEPSPSIESPGQVKLIECSPGLDTQAKYLATDTIPDLLETGVSHHKIAVLYPQKGILLDSLKKALEETEIPFRIEREETFPSSPIIKWLQRCAAYNLSSSPERSEPISNLFVPYSLLAQEAGFTQLESRLSLSSAITKSILPDLALSSWLRKIADELNLIEMLKLSGRLDEAEDIETLKTNYGSTGIADFAKTIEAEGEVVVTTYHSSKGRQFDAVLLPGLQNTLVPRTRWNPRNKALETNDMNEERRLFYVALTRARHSAHLCYSSSFSNKNGYLVSGRSVFVDEIAKALNSSFSS